MSEDRFVPEKEYVESFTSRGLTVPPFLVFQQYVVRDGVPGYIIAPDYETVIESLKQERMMVASTFEAITGFDYTKAYKEYADAIGITIDQLTTQQKQQVVMNAVTGKDTIMVNWDNEEPLDGLTEPVKDAQCPNIGVMDAKLKEA